MRMIRKKKKIKNNLKFIKIHIIKLDAVKKRRHFLLTFLFVSSKIKKKQDISGGNAMRKYLLSESGKFYKANLHCHTTLSDGKTTPEETKKAYMDKGYSVIAFTDHKNFFVHNDLTEETFLALNGYEADVGLMNPKGWNCSKLCHICVIALDKNITEVPVWENKAYTGESISAFMKNNVENGFFVTYNHPNWSLESYPEYINYKGASALEIINYGCIVEGYDDRNDHVYDDMLRGGERIFAIAADDNHNPPHDSFGGYTMIKAESLTYEDVAKSLKEGNFYASEGGPDILELYVEDGKVCIKTDKAREIYFSTDRRRCRRALGNEAVFEIGECDYFRLTAVGEDGKESYTNAYFLFD